MKYVRTLVVWSILGGVVGAIAGFTTNIVRDVQRIDTMEKQMQKLYHDGGTP